MNRTKIEWVKNPDGTQGYTWNPITGCLNNCSYCYARKLANGRLKKRYLANTEVANPIHYGTIVRGAHYPFDDPFYPRFWEDRLRELDPIWKSKHFTVGGGSKVQPKGIFVCDMSDLFGIGIPEDWTRRVLDVIKSNPYHRFYLLTKQPQNLIKFSPFPKNVWCGVTVTNNEMLSPALERLRFIEASVKYLSFEPLLDAITGYDGCGLSYLLEDSGIEWVIIGAQTKPYKPPKMTWVEEIVGACDKASVKVFLKDNLLELVNYQSPETEFAFNKEGYYRQEMPDG
ncbi:hypothetical protein ES703_114802 [subsurface metagenome]